jgi:acyl-coenzyme A synthetase/AMP-(fatty) acid ligase
MSDKPREELEKLAAALDAEKQTLPSFLRHAAKVQPADAIAIQQGLSPARTLTYSQFVALTYTLASKLRSAGVKAGQIVPILTWRKNVELIVAQYAVMLCGAAFAPMDPTFPTGVTKHKIGKAKASIVIALDMEDRKLEELEKEGALHGASSFRLKEGDCHPGGDEGEEKDEAQADETAYVMFTSGSTGNPKGVLQTHRQACASLKGFIPQFSFGPGARVLSTISAA